MSGIVSLSFSLDQLSKRTAVEEILRTNKVSWRHGLILTENDVLELVETRNTALRSSGRIEIGSGTIIKIIAAFCPSSFIWQENYAATLHDLLEGFYYMKNETLDLIPDDELIGLMRDYFETRCQGSIDLLLNRELEQLARNLRYGVEDYANLAETSEEEVDEEEVNFE